MAKQGGLGDHLLIGGYDLSGDIGSIQRINGGPKPLVVTGINKEAFERIGGTRDGGINYNAFYNKAAGQAHPRLSSLPTTDVIVTYCRASTLGNPSACCVTKQLNYDGTRAADGMYTFDAEQPSNGYGVEWGKQLTAFLRTDTGATNGTGVDFGTGSTSFGLQAYLQVTAFDGTDITIKLQESSDNGSGDAFADVTGGAFTTVTGITTQRIATATNLTVERYLRVVTSGTFNSVTFHVMVNRNDTVPQF